MRDITHEVHYEKLRKKLYGKYFKPKQEQYIKELTPTIFNKIGKQYTNTFMAILDDQMIGFITISKNCKDVLGFKSDIIKLECIYIEKEYRYNFLATKMINDLQHTMRNDYVDYEYLFANSFVESVLFFLKNRFDYYKKGKGLPDKRSIITMYKPIL